MPLKNYTTEVPATKSISQIEKNLVDHGARAIMVNYSNNREPESLSFIIVTPQGEVTFRLPAKVKSVTALLLKQLSSLTYRQWDNSYQKKRQQKALEQASRVAWRIIKDWVDAQLAIIETDMATMEEVFLPYMEVKNGQTLYELMQEKRFLLTEGSEK